MSKQKLLLADDSITIQKVVNLTFADQGMDVFAFSDGDSAVERLDEIRPDIVLADVNMPGINGYQLCELMRSDDSNRNIPVVLLVGSFEPFDREEAERVGSSAFLTKPFTSIAELVSTVQGLLAERGAAATAGVSVTTAIPVEPLPDTSDIDSLYEQSFVETVELPQNNGDKAVFGDEGLDDDMIETSYAKADLGDEVEEVYFATEPAAEYAESAAQMEDLEAESLIAESLPHPEQVTDEGWVAAAVKEQPENDPFVAVAGDLPPVEKPSEPQTVPFDLDDDLLELPGTGSPTQSANSGQFASSAKPLGEIKSLSPDLIDLIVDKVIERLESKTRG